MRWREHEGIRWLEAVLPGATAAFSTRLGGISTGSYASLNLAVLTGDSREAVAENRRRLAAAVDRDDAGIVYAHQVHGDQLIRHTGRPAEPGFAGAVRADTEADGHVTADPALTPLVFVADCLPIALSGPGGVAMLHGGWRGLAAGIVAAGAEAVAAVGAAVGPGIGPCCFEVGPEVLDAFAPLGDGIADGRMLDLREVARRLLGLAGVVEIEISELCTRCQPELFFSHRGEGARTGRQAGLAWLVEGAHG